MFIILKVHNSTVMVNLAQVRWIEPLDNGSRLCFEGTVHTGVRQYLDVYTSYSAMMEHLKRYNAVRGNDLS